jgi:hypothetical protein
MIIKGVSDIKGMHGVNTRPGPLKESDALLELYQLATEKDHLMKKLQWVRRQKEQTEKRLSEIAYTVHAVEKRRKREPISTSHSEVRSMFIEY